MYFKFMKVDLKKTTSFTLCEGAKRILFKILKLICFPPSQYYVILELMSYNFGFGF